MFAEQAFGSVKPVLVHGRTGTGDLDVLRLKQTAGAMRQQERDGLSGSLNGLPRSPSRTTPILVNSLRTRKATGPVRPGCEESFIPHRLIPGAVILLSHNSTIR
jgi:hypothetical protein